MDDKMSIQFETSSEKAEPKIKSLIDILTRLDTIVTNATESMNNLAKAIKSINSSDTKNLEKVTNVSTLATNQSINDTNGYKDTVEPPDESKWNKFFSNISTKLSSLSKPNGLSNMFKSLGNSLKDTGANVKNLSKIFGSLKSVGVGAVLGVTKAFKTFGKVVSGTKNVVGKVVSNVRNSLKKIVKSLRLTSLALLGVRGTFTAIRKAVSEYMSYDQTLNSQLRNDWAVLGSLLAPVLERIIKLFSILVSYVASFVKALTGIDLVARANQKGLDAQTKSMKKANNELGNLPNFDDLNVVNFDKDSGNNDFTPLKIEDVDMSPIDKLVKKLKENDWYGIGMEIGRKLNEGLSSIDFEWLLEKAKKWATNFADLFNGLTDGIDFNLLGESFAKGLNVILISINTFFEKANFEKFGEKLTNGLNKMVETVNWEALGQFLTNKFNTLTDIFYEFATKFKFDELGEKLSIAINSFVENIKFDKFISAFSKAIQGALNTISKILDNIKWDKIAEKINNSLKNLELGNVAKSLSNAVLSALKGLNKLIFKINWTEIGNQVADALTNINWLGIIAQLFTLIGNLLLASIKLLWGFVKTLFTNLWNMFKESEFGSNIIELFKVMFNGEVLEWVKSFFGDMVNNIKEAFNGIGDFFKEKFTKAKENVKDAWSNTKSFFSEKWEDIKEAFSNTGDFFKEKFSDAWSNTKDAWSNTKSFFSEKWTNIKDAFSNTGNFFKEKFSNAWSNTKDAWKNTKSFFGEKKTDIEGEFKDIGSFFKEKFSNAWENVKTPFKNVKTFFKEKFDGITDVFKNVGTSIGDAIGGSFKNIINKVLKWVGDKINGFVRSINKGIDVINKIPGVNINPLKEFSIPQLKTGTNKIEQEGLYHLHKNEAVVPEKYNPAVNNQVYENTNDRLIERIDRFMSIVENMETTNVFKVDGSELHRSTKRYLDKQAEIYGY